VGGSRQHELIAAPADQERDPVDGSGRDPRHERADRATTASSRDKGRLRPSSTTPGTARRANSPKGSACISKKRPTVAIDGEIHEVGYRQPLRNGSEVFFIPKIEGG
jgi:hypothetical protein